jgi:hypothetical protein
LIMLVALLKHLDGKCRAERGSHSRSGTRSAMWQATFASSRLCG